jgi:hypothetical protein
MPQPERFLQPRTVDLALSRSLARKSGSSDSLPRNHKLHTAILLSPGGSGIVGSGLALAQPSSGNRFRLNALGNQIVTNEHDEPQNCD